MHESDETPDSSEAVEAADMGDDRGPARAAPRSSLFLLAPLTDASGNPIGKARVRNLSATGMMAEGERPFHKGMRVQVELRGIGQVPGTIAWTADGDLRIGIHFDHNIDPQLARKPVGQGTPASLIPDYLRTAPKRFGR